MESPQIPSRGIFVLPNEILLNVLNLFPTRDLLPFSSTCQHIHSLFLDLLRRRLQVAAGLDDHLLILECHPPSSVRQKAARLFCGPLGTPGLDDLPGNRQSSQAKHLGEIERLGNCYSRFRPTCKEPNVKRPPQKHPAGDIPGSRSYHAPSNDDASVPSSSDPNEVVRDTVTVDAHLLFSQLMTVASLLRVGTRSGQLSSVLEVSDGIIRVWRDWLKRQCESRSFSDLSMIKVYHDDSRQADALPDDPKQDPSILWLNTGNESVGIKFRVTRQMHCNLPSLSLMHTSEVEVAVTYEVEFEEVLIRTTHLLLKLEEAQTQLSNESGRAIVFGVL